MYNQLMKRDRRLYPLSWDHHHGLVLARKINLGVGEKSPEALERAHHALLEFWEQDLHSHFLAEEEVLFPAVRNLEACTADIEIALAEHRQFCQMIATLILPANTDELRQVLTRFAELLVQHIRFEENVIFPKIEASLSNDAMDEIGKELSERRKY